MISVKRTFAISTLHADACPSLQRTKSRNLEERVDLLLLENKHLEDRVRDLKARPFLRTRISEFIGRWSLLSKLCCVHGGLCLSLVIASLSTTCARFLRWFSGHTKQLLHAQACMLISHF